MRSISSVPRAVLALALLPLLARAESQDAEYPPRSLEPTSGACPKPHSTSACASAHSRMPSSNRVRADPRSWSVADVQSWVDSVGFSEYREAFSEAKIDGARLLGTGSAEALQAELLLPATEHAAVLAFEIGDLRARRNLFTSRAERDAHFAAHPLADGWDEADVTAFLQDAGLGRHAPRFAAAGVDGRGLLRLTDDDLSALVGAHAAGDEWEEGLADAGLLQSLVATLRWRSATLSGRGKEEL
jgi:hypothetical protein